MSRPTDWDRNGDGEGWGELDELARRAFNPDDMIDVVLPSGAVARVAPDVPLETLASLDAMAALMIEQAMDEQAPGVQNGGH